MAEFIWIDEPEEWGDAEELTLSPSGGSVFPRWDAQRAARDAEVTIAYDGESPTAPESDGNRRETRPDFVIDEEDTVGDGVERDDGVPRTIVRMSSDEFVRHVVAAEIAGFVPESDTHEAAARALQELEDAADAPFRVPQRTIVRHRTQPPPTHREPRQPQGSFIPPYLGRWARHRLLRAHGTREQGQTAPPLMFEDAQDEVELAVWLGEHRSETVVEHEDDDEEVAELYTPPTAPALSLADLLPGANTHAGGARDGPEAGAGRQRRQRRRNRRRSEARTEAEDELLEAAREPRTDRAADQAAAHERPVDRAADQAAARENNRTRDDGDAETLESAVLVHGPFPTGFSRQDSSQRRLSLPNSRADMEDIVERNAAAAAASVSVSSASAAASSAIQPRTPTAEASLEEAKRTIISSATDLEHQLGLRSRIDIDTSLTPAVMRNGAVPPVWETHRMRTIANRALPAFWGHAAAIHGDHLYVFGGWKDVGGRTGSVLTDDVRVYSFQDRAWFVLSNVHAAARRRAPLASVAAEGPDNVPHVFVGHAPPPSYHCTATAVGTNIVVFGGGYERGQGSITPFVHLFDVQTFTYRIPTVYVEIEGLHEAVPVPPDALASLDASTTVFDDLFGRDHEHSWGDDGYQPADLEMLFAILRGDDGENSEGPSDRLADESAAEGAQAASAAREPSTSGSPDPPVIIVAGPTPPPPPQERHVQRRLREQRRRESRRAAVFQPRFASLCATLAGRMYHTCTEVEPGLLVMVGGETRLPRLARSGQYGRTVPAPLVAMFDAATSTWLRVCVEPSQSLPTSIVGHSAVLTARGIVIHGGILTGCDDGGIVPGVRGSETFLLRPRFASWRGRDASGAVSLHLSRVKPPSSSVRLIPRTGHVTFADEEGSTVFVYGGGAPPMRLRMDTMQWEHVAKPKCGVSFPDSLEGATALLHDGSCLLVGGRVRSEERSQPRKVFMYAPPSARHYCDMNVEQNVWTATLCPSLNPLVRSVSPLEPAASASADSFSLVHADTCVPVSFAKLREESRFFQSLSRTCSLEFCDATCEIKCSEDAFATLLHFLRTGEYSCDGDADLEVLEVADRFGMPKLLRLCEIAVEGKMDRNNVEHVLYVLDVAARAHARALARLCCHFAAYLIGEHTVRACAQWKVLGKSVQTDLGIAFAKTNPARSTTSITDCVFGGAAH